MASWNHFVVVERFRGGGTIDSCSLSVLKYTPIKTRGDLLRLDLFMALSDAVKLVRGARKAMAIAEREAIAADTVRRVASKPGDPWRLKEELPLPGPAMPEGWDKRTE
jgi:hypothetical protein